MYLMEFSNDKYRDILRAIFLPTVKLYEPRGRNPNLHWLKVSFTLETTHFKDRSKATDKLK